MKSMSGTLPIQVKEDLKDLYYNKIAEFMELFYNSHPVR